MGAIVPMAPSKRASVGGEVEVRFPGQASRETAEDFVDRRVQEIGFRSKNRKRIRAPSYKLTVFCLVVIGCCALCES